MKKKKVIAFSIDEGLLNIIDSKIERLMMSRSRFIVEAIKKYIEKVSKKENKNND